MQNLRADNLDVNVRRCSFSVPCISANSCNARSQQTALNASCRVSDKSDKMVHITPSAFNGIFTAQCYASEVLAIESLHIRQALVSRKNNASGFLIGLPTSIGTDVFLNLNPSNTLISTYFHSWCFSHNKG